ncbi:MAG: glycosyltransferase family 4 protein [Candidatus Helarchaeota archaeon]
MRIGIISSGTQTDRIPPIFGGGLQNYAWCLGKELQKRGHEVHIFTALQTSQLKEEMLEGIYLHRVSIWKPFKLFSTILFGIKTFFKIMKLQKIRGPFTILHAQSRVSSLILQSMKILKTPMIFTVHNWDITIAPSGTYVPPFTYGALLFIEKLAYSKCNQLLVLTKYFRRLVKSRFRIPASKIAIIPNMTGVGAVESKQKKPVLPPEVLDRPFLLYIGRLEKEKGLIQLITIFKTLQVEQKTLNLVIVGDGTLKSRLRELRTEFSLQKQLFILGKLHRKYVNWLLEKATALVLASEFEIMPTVILEAWAAKCPVIVKTYEGVSELIHHRETGLLFEQFDDFPALVFELVNNKALRDHLKRQAFIKLQNQFEVSQVVPQIQRLYLRLLRKKRKIQRT